MALLSAAPSAMAGANLVAIGTYSEMPLARAEGRISLSGKEVVYTFDDPHLDFGRVVVRSTDALSVVKRDLFVGYNGAGLAIDTGPQGGGAAARVGEVEFWLRIEGTIFGGRKYEWEFEGGVPGEEIDGFPAIIPMLWADGQPIGAEVTIAEPVPEDTDRIQRLMIPRGIIDVPEFERQTGAAWIVLKPQRVGGVFIVQRMSLREVEDSPEAISASRMPIPVRYIPIKDPLEDQIAEVLDRTPTVLKNLQRPNGAFADGAGEPVVTLTGDAATAIALIEPTAEHIAKACEWLSQQAPEGNQVWAADTVSARLEFMSMSCGKEKYGVIRKDVDSLTQAQLKDGGWPVAAAGAQSGSRGAAAEAPRADHFTTVNALRALRAAQLAGIEVNDRVWKSGMTYWTEAQSYGGGYTDRLSRYGGAGQVTSTGFTALGGGALLLSLDMASSTGAKRCGTYLASSQQLRAIDGALDWLNDNYADEEHESGSFITAANPYLKPLASIVLAQISGVVELDEKNVLREAAAGMLQHYDRASAMFGVRGPQGFATAPSPNLAAIGLRSLAAAGAPTVCQRIVVGDDDKGWAQYSMDVPHLVQYLSRKRGRALNWRRTDIDQDLREIAEVPMTVLRVQGDFEWTDEQWKKLREYCLVGGTVLIDVAPDAEAMREKLKSSLAAAFPEYKLADVPADDPMLRAAAEKTGMPGLQGISNGFRHFVLVPAESWSCHWQLNQLKEHEASFAFMDGLLTYATDGTDPRSSFAPSPYEVGAASSKNLSAARIQVGSEVPAYPNLVDTMNRLLQANYRLEVKEAKPAEADVLWVNVAGPGPIAAQEAQQVLSSIKGGKFILADVISGNEDWAEEFEGELKKLDGKLSVEKMLRTDPVFTGAVPGTRGFNVTRVHLRKALHTRFDKAGRCDLHTILWEGKPVGVFSAHDLSSGVGYHYFPECRGPLPDGARQIAMNIFLSAYGKKLGVTTAQR